MNELVPQAAEALLPLVVGGAGAVAVGAAEQAGSDFYGSAVGLLERMRHLIKRPDKNGVAEALDEALARGVIEEGDVINLIQKYANKQGQEISIGSVNSKVTMVGKNKIRNLNA